MNDPNNKFLISEGLKEYFHDLENFKYTEIIDALKICLVDYQNRLNKLEKLENFKNEK